MSLPVTLPASVCASRALAQSERFCGPLHARSCKRLEEFTPSDDSALDVDLVVRQDAAGQAWLTGTVRGRLGLICRRCQERFDWALAAAVELMLVSTEEEEAHLMELGDALWVRDDRLDVHEIVEDEVLLSVPMMPSCPACENVRPPAAAMKDEPVAMRKSLAALKDLNLSGAQPARRE